MNADKIKEIIQRKNEQLEDNAVRTAEQLVNDIVELQESISDATKQITEKREELRKLQIASIDAGVILGG